MDIDKTACTIQGEYVAIRTPKPLQFPIPFFSWPSIFQKKATTDLLFGSTTVVAKYAYDWIKLPWQESKYTWTWIDGSRCALEFGFDYKADLKLIVNEQVEYLRPFGANDWYRAESDAEFLSVDITYSESRFIAPRDEKVICTVDHRDLYTSWRTPATLSDFCGSQEELLVIWACLLKRFGGYFNV